MSQVIYCQNFSNRFSGLRSDSKSISLAFGLGDLAGGSIESGASGVSGDGSVVVGYGSSASGYEAFLWTSGSGMVGLGDLPGGSTESSAYGVSGDGSVVVGVPEVPEPSTIVMLLTGGVGLIGYGWRRKKKLAA